MLREESPTHLDPELVGAFRSCYSGKAPLAFWESLAAWTTAADFFPHRAPASPTRLSLRQVVATTLAATVVALAAITAPIGTPAGEHHPAAPSPTRSIALTPRHANPPRPGSARTRPTHAQAQRPAHIVMHRPAAPTGLPMAASHGTQTSTTRRRTQPGTGQTPSAPVATGRPSPSTHPPTTTAHPPPPKPRPRPTSPRPPTATTVNPPQTTPTTLGSGTPATTTTPSSAPTSTAATPPITSGSGHPTSKDACKKGGYVQYGFSNQGQCIAAVQHGG